MTMFAEYLGAHPLSTLVTALPRCPFPPARNRAAWEALPEDRRDALRRLAETYRGMEYPSLTARQFMAFARAGDRAAFEGPYFLRRRKLCAALLGICADGDMAGLDDVIDGVWLICEETGWNLSAHNDVAPLPDPDRPVLDLFAAQTAMILSLACALLSDELDAASPLIRRRVRREIELRVLQPFEARDDLWWMGFTGKDLCNWTPWIISNVMLTACAWADDVPRLCALLERGCGMLDRYLAALPGDGGCDEGPGYWSMAGGAVLDCLDLMERVTGGKMALWDDPKLRAVLRFPLNAWLGGPWFANFADCDAKPDIPGERLRFAGEKLDDPALQALGARFEQSPADHLADTPQLWRLLNGLFHPRPSALPDVAPPGDTWLPDLQLRVVRAGGMVLACKGGVNAGSHSHNDCGGFILLVDGEPQIVDAGNMTYTGATFSEGRYTLFNTRGMYHNVPVIGDHEQVSGPNRRAKDVAATPSGLALDIADAYPVEGCVVRRTLALDKHMALLDEIVLPAPLPVTEGFLLRRRPEICENTVISGAIRIVPAFDAAIVVEEIPVDDPRMAKNYPGSLWRAAFTDAPALKHTLRFQIERNDR